jgi:hypothetical protein
MRYVTVESSTEGATRREHVSNYQVKLYKELRSLARLGVPARRRVAPDVRAVQYSEALARTKD